MAFNLKSALLTIAPTIAGMLGTPFAGVAVSALEAAFGLSPGAGVDGITKVVQEGGMTPDIIAAVRTADQKHAEIMGQQGIDLVKINADFVRAQTDADNADRDSARRREMAIKDQTPARLAFVIIGGFFAVSIAQLIGLMVWSADVAAIPPQGWLLIGNISGYLAAEAKAASSYYFGTTRGSADKTQLLAEASSVASGKS